MPSVWIHGLHTLSLLRQVAQDIPAGNSVCLVPPDILPNDAPCSVNDEDCGCGQPIVEAVVGVVCPRNGCIAAGVEDWVCDRFAGGCQGSRCQILSTGEVVHADGQHFRAALSNLVIVSLQLT